MTVSLSLGGIRQYFENVFDAIDPGGTFVGAEWVRSRTDVAERFGFHVLTMSEVGNTYSEDEYLSALDAGGFVDTEIRDVPGTRFQLMSVRNQADTVGRSIELSSPSDW